MLAILQSGLAVEGISPDSICNSDTENCKRGPSRPYLGADSLAMEVERGKVCHERQAGTSPWLADHDR